MDQLFEVILCPFPNLGIGVVNGHALRLDEKPVEPDNLNACRLGGLGDPLPFGHRDVSHGFGKGKGRQLDAPIPQSSRVVEDLFNGPALE